MGATGVWTAGRLCHVLAIMAASMSATLLITNTLYNEITCSHWGVTTLCPRHRGATIFCTRHLPPGITIPSVSPSEGNRRLKTARSRRHQSATEGCRPPGVAPRFCVTSATANRVSQVVSLCPQALPSSRSSRILSFRIKSSPLQGGRRDTPYPLLKAWGGDGIPLIHSLRRGQETGYPLSSS